MLAFLLVVVNRADEDEVTWLHVRVGGKGDGERVELVALDRLSDPGTSATHLVPAAQSEPKMLPQVHHTLQTSKVKAQCTILPVGSCVYCVYCVCVGWGVWGVGST